MRLIDGGGGVELHGCLVVLCRVEVVRISQISMRCRRYCMLQLCVMLVGWVEKWEHSLLHLCTMRVFLPMVLLLA